MVKLQVVENTSSFEQFWKEYPRKVGKKVAMKIWLKIDPKLHEKIMFALLAQKEVWSARGTEMQYIPHASTWLNQERWEDEIEEAGWDGRF